MFLASLDKRVATVALDRDLVANPDSQVRMELTKSPMCSLIVEAGAERVRLTLI